MRLKTQKAKKDNKYIRAVLLSVVAFIILSSTSIAEARHHKGHHAPGCNTRRCDRWAGVKWMHHHPFTGYVVEGKVSVFGALTGDSSTGITYDEGTTSRPCIAIRNYSTMGHYFLVTVAGYGHSAKLLHCDYGPAEETGRNIDITGEGAIKLGISITNFPTDAQGRARELR